MLRGSVLEAVSVNHNDDPREWVSLEEFVRLFVGVQYLHLLNVLFDDGQILCMSLGLADGDI
jgi:hypothetical protein